MRSVTKLPWTRIVGTGRVILCLTTLSHRRFVDDVIQVVGLPIGSKLLLRYRKRYVSEGLWTAAGNSSTQSWHALIVLGGVSSQGTDRYESIRIGRVSTIAVSGEILTLEIQLTGYATDENYGWPQVAAAAKNLPASLTGNAAKQGLYVQELSHCPSSILADESVEGWERTCDAFFRVDTSKQVPFLFMMQSDSESAFSRYRDEGELVVESGGKLAWNMHTKCAPRTQDIVSPLGEILVEVSCPPMRMVTSRRIRVDSRRDIRQMSLACDAVFRTVRGHLSVKLVTFQSNNEGQSSQVGRELTSLSRHDIPLRAGRILPTVASFAVGAATTVAMLDKSGWHEWQNFAAITAGLLVFLSLKYGFRGSGGS